MECQNLLTFLAIIVAAFLAWNVVRYLVGRYSPADFVAVAHLSECLKKQGIDPKSVDPSLLQYLAERAVILAGFGRPSLDRVELAKDIEWSAHLWTCALRDQFPNEFQQKEWEGILAQRAERIAKLNAR
jgi:hypothetical protein